MIINNQLFFLQNQNSNNHHPIYQQQQSSHQHSHPHLHHNQHQQHPHQLKQQTQPKEKVHRQLNEVTCFKCGEKGHYANKCPKGHHAFLSSALKELQAKRS